MVHRSRRIGWLVAAALGLAALPGCVERRMVIMTEPYGAVVYDERDQPLGAAPVDRAFTYYGKYRFRLVKDGYETLIVEEDVRPPWYEVFPLDFISENLIPWTLRDVRYFRYQLQPAQVVPPEVVRDQAQRLRDRGQTIGTPPAPVPAPISGPGPQTPLLMPPVREP